MANDFFTAPRPERVLVEMFRAALLRYIEETNSVVVLDVIESFYDVRIRAESIYVRFAFPGLHGLALANRYSVEHRVDVDHLRISSRSEEAYRNECFQEATLFIDGLRRMPELQQLLREARRGAAITHSAIHSPFVVPRERQESRKPDVPSLVQPSPPEKPAEKAVLPGMRNLRQTAGGAGVTPIKFNRMKR